MSNLKDRSGVPPDPMTRFPEPLSRFVELFNRGEFWESHEVLEGAWRAARSDFYQGLILYASAFVHVQRGNARGVIAQLEKTERRLAPYPKTYLGLDVARILEHSRALRAQLLGTPAPAHPSLLGEIPFPTLALSEDLVSGTEPELTDPS